MPKDALNRLQEEMMLLHTYNSNAIEGNTLTLQETKLVVEEGITIGGKSLAEQLEATWNAKAFETIETLAKGHRKIDLPLILEIHEIVSNGLLEDSGRFRTQNMRIAGSKKNPPDFSKVPKLMDELLIEVAKIRTNNVHEAAYLHHRIVEIHPFTDGNGRVARLISNLVLMKSGYHPVVLRKDDRKKYDDCLRKADFGNIRSFVDFIGRALDESLTLFISIFGGKNALVPLSELSKDFPYSQEYLSL